MRVVDAVGFLGESAAGGVLILGTEEAIDDAAGALSAADIPCVSLTSALLERLDQPQSLADRELSALHTDEGGHSRIALDAARADVRTALSDAYERLLSELATIPRLVVRDLELALAERLDPERLADGRETIAWLLPGARANGRTRLYHHLSPPGWLERCEHIWELADESR